MNIIKRFVKGCCIVLGLTLCAGCTLMPKANQIKGLETASTAIGSVQALDCDGIRAALATVYPEAIALDCGTVRVVLAASQALVQQQKATLQK